jgi:hypothetical protein
VRLASTVRCSALPKKEKTMNKPSNPFPGADAGRTPGFIEMRQLGVSQKSWSARLSVR